MITIGNGLILYIEIVIGVVAFVSALFVAFNVAALKNYKETITSQEVRLASLEDDNKKLKDRVNQLEGQERGYELAVRLLINEITMSAICENAPSCANRKPPERVLKDFKERTQQGF